MSPSPVFVLRTCAVLALAPVAAAQANTEYTAREVMLPMRDGVKLYTQIFEPAERSEALPILIRRTPYNVGPLPRTTNASEIGPSPLFAEEGYIFVRQDVRGQFRSEGEWEVLRPPRRVKADPSAVDETTDAFDTIDWLLESVEGHNGRVGMWGVSYSAWETVMAMADAHPALVAVSPQASPADMFVGDDIHHNGAFRLSYMFSWMSGMAAARGELDRGVVDAARRQDGYEYFLDGGGSREISQSHFGDAVPAWSDLMAHGTYDEFWRRRNPFLLLGDVRPAVLNVAGWFDAEDFRGPIDIYHRVEARDEGDRNCLVIGPWKHGGWNFWSRGPSRSLRELDFGWPTGEWFREQVELPFFEHHLRSAADPRFPEVHAFETGGEHLAPVRSVAAGVDRGAAALLVERRGGLVPPSG